MNVAFFSAKSFDRDYFDKFNGSESHQLTYFEAPLNQHTINLTKGYDVVCAFVNDKLDKQIITELAENKVGLIALRCAGFNNVDLLAARENDVKVVRVPTYSPQAVAEHAVALILTLNRKTHKAYNRIREGNFSLDKLVGFDLSGKTVGVIGTGYIGSIFSRIMLGFNCRVIAYDVNRSKLLENEPIDYVPLDDLFSNSDIISLHCPLTAETHHLINKESYSKMKKGLMLINTSRGALIKTKDTIKALKKGKLGYLGLDVYEEEENLFFKDLSESIIQDDMIARLMSFPNVLITSHQGFFTKEALQQIASTTLKNISDFEKGSVLENEVKIE